MGALKFLPKKLRLIAAGKVKGAPRWCDLKKFGKRARTRRIRVARTKHWRRGKLKM
jgi:ribosomal protein L39E